MGGGAPSRTSTLTYSQENAAKLLGTRVQTGLAQGAGIKPYQGNLVAPLQLPAGMQSQISGFDASATNRQAQQGLSSILGGQSAGSLLTPDQTNQLYQGSIFNPMMHSFQTQVAPQISQAFAGAGRSFSSEAGFAKERALSDMNVAGQAQLSQAVFQNQQLQAQYQNDAYQRQLAGLSLAPQIASMGLSQAGQQQSLLAPYQAQQQAQLNAAYQKWTTAQPYNNPWLSLSNQYIGEGQTAVYQPQIGPGAQIANALAGQSAGLGVSAALGTNGANIASLLGIGASSSGIAGISSADLAAAATSGAAMESTGAVAGGGVAETAPFIAAALA